MRRNRSLEGRFRCFRTAPIADKVWAFSSAWLHDISLSHQIACPLCRVCLHRHAREAKIGRIAETEWFLYHVFLIFISPSGIISKSYPSTQKFKFERPNAKNGINLSVE